MSFYHQGQRALQNHFESVPLADRLEQVTHRTRFTEDDRSFIEASAFFFLATADAQGRPDCSYKGGAPGFVRVLQPDLLVFPDYDGNGMLRSLGNIQANPAVGLLFVRMDESPKRIRVNGRARVSLDDPLLPSFPGAISLVHVTPEHIFPNCPRYVHDLVSNTHSPYTPAEGVEPVEPKWKSFDSFSDVVPPRRR
jgi:predicted pyridoxine 5'-phosphate oxidase superfamily flavin-nucleotide-binding protein